MVEQEQQLSTAVIMIASY